MALSFIKKVFTFGKPAEEPVPAAVERELEPRSRDEDLPVADDPVLAEEMDTAGGPAADIDEGGVEAAVADDDVESSILPAADQLSDMGVVPLSLLEAEAAAEAETEADPIAVDVAEAPPLSLRDISPTRGRSFGDWRAGFRRRALGSRRSAF